MNGGGRSRRGPGVFALEADGQHSDGGRWTPPGGEGKKVEKEAKVVLESLAELHAHFWGKVEGVQRGGFWVLLRRHGEELGADEAWRGLLQRFPKLLELHPEVEKIGSIVGEKAVELDSFVGERGLTRIHGDAKGWNFFFGSEKAASSFLFIDMQWTGRGHPLQVLIVTMRLKIKNHLHFQL